MSPTLFRLVTEPAPNILAEAAADRFASELNAIAGVHGADEMTAAKILADFGIVCIGIVMANEDEATRQAVASALLERRGYRCCPA